MKTYPAEHRRSQFKGQAYNLPNMDSYAGSSWFHDRLREDMEQMLGHGPVRVLFKDGKPVEQA